jgi:hypothetical protein
MNKSTKNKKYKLHTLSKKDVEKKLNVNIDDYQLVRVNNLIKIANEDNIVKKVLDKEPGAEREKLIKFFKNISWYIYYGIVVHILMGSDITKSRLTLVNQLINIIAEIFNYYVKII